MIASLGMYDRAECQAANDRFWALIRDGLRARGIAAPDALTRGEAAYWPAWQAADLVLSQTCGAPYRTRLHGTVTLVGTPDYGLPGCAPGYYQSVLVIRADDPRDRLAAFGDAGFAYNDTLSQSGWAAPLTHAASLGLRLTPTLETGGHALSALAVAEGRADIAALDAQTWRLICRHDAPLAGRLRVLEATPPTPGLPLIAGPGADGPATFAAVADAIAALSGDDRDLLGLRAIIAIPATTYLAVPNPPPISQFARPD